MTKGHTNFGASGLHGLEKKIKLRKKRVTVND